MFQNRQSLEYNKVKVNVYLCSHTGITLTVYLLWFPIYLTWLLKNAAYLFTCSFLGIPKQKQILHCSSFLCNVHEGAGKVCLPNPALCVLWANLYRSKLNYQHVFRAALVGCLDSFFCKYLTLQQNWLYGQHNILEIVSSWENTIYTCRGFLWAHVQNVSISYMWLECIVHILLYWTMY